MKNRFRAIIFCLFTVLLFVGCAHKPTEEDTSVNLKQAADINSQLGMSYLQAGDVKRAKQRFLKALQESPKEPVSWYSMGYFLEATGNTKEAEQYYLRAIKLDPNNGNAKNNYGTYLCHSGRYIEGIKQFFAAVKCKNFVDNAGAYENIGLCALKIPDYKTADIYLNRTLELDANRPESIGGLAMIYYHQRNYKQARQYFESYIKLAEQPTIDMYKLGVNLYAKLGDQRTSAKYAALLRKNNYSAKIKKG